ncbi:MAG: hypothetical protein ACJ741_02680 [Pyrinomonadaceae bacterium]
MMPESDRINNDAARAEGGVAGDVETAGETTAAATVGAHGDNHNQPVGADTMVKIADAPRDASGED